MPHIFVFQIIAVTGFIKILAAFMFNDDILKNLFLNGRENYVRNAAGRILDDGAGYSIKNLRFTASLS